MKKYSAILLTVFLLLGITACAGEPDTSLDANTTTTIPEDAIPPEQVVKSIDAKAVAVHTETTVYQATVSDSQVAKVREKFMDSGYTTVNATPVAGTRLAPEVLRAGNTMVTLQQADTSVRVMWETCDPSAFSLLSPNKATGTGTVTMAQIGAVANTEIRGSNMTNGMSYVYKLSDGSAVIVDGGFNESAESLYNVLEKLDIAKDENGRYRITAWVLTHLHDDHYGALITFAANYRTNADISYLVYAFSIDERIFGKIDHTPSFVAYMKEHYPNTVHIAPHAGLQYYFDNMTLQMLYAPELLYGSEELLNDGNQTSIVFALDCNGTRVLHLGDAGEVATGAAWNANEESAFKAPIFQVPHHMLTTGHDASGQVSYEWMMLSIIYETTGAKTALAPMGVNCPKPEFPDNGRWAVLLNWAQGGAQSLYFIDINATTTNNVSYSQAEYKSFISNVAAGTSQYKTLCGYDGINKIYNAERDLTTYIMCCETEAMATVFTLSKGNYSLVTNQTLAQWLDSK